MQIGLCDQLQSNDIFYWKKYKSRASCFKKMFSTCMSSFYMASSKKTYSNSSIRVRSQNPKICVKLNWHQIYLWRLVIIGKCYLVLCRSILKNLSLAPKYYFWNHFKEYWITFYEYELTFQAFNVTNIWPVLYK